MASREIPCAASSLLTALLDGPERPLQEAARTRVSVHYETGDPLVPVLTVCRPDAVRLPSAIVAEALPEAGPALIGLGRFGSGTTLWRVNRWWRPERPAGLVPPGGDLATLVPTLDDSLGVPLPRPAYDGLRPAVLVGRGPGLTPAGDDVLAGALVAAHATADPRLSLWRSATVRALATAGTTPVSRALLHHACDGYATPELAELLVALCEGGDVTGARANLLDVGHVSGAALLIGALHSLSTHRLEGAA